VGRLNLVRRCKRSYFRQPSNDSDHIWSPDHTAPLKIPKAYDFSKNTTENESRLKRQSCKSQKALLASGLLNGNG
jgi:hypothetical protein